MELVFLESTLLEPELLGILAQSVYYPTEERVKARAKRYLEDERVYSLGFCENKRWKGVLICRFSQPGILEILDIAVAKEDQKQGIGKMMIEQCIKKLRPRQVLAQTDDDAVQFYQKCGFSVKTLGQKYEEGIVRYLCSLACNN